MTEIAKQAVADSVNDQLLDRAIKHQIYIEQFGKGTAEKIIKELVVAEEELLGKLASRLVKAQKLGIDTGPLTTKRLASIPAGFGEIIDNKYSSVYNDRLKPQLIALSRGESKYIAKELEAVLPIDVNTVMPSPNRLRTIVTSRPFEGAVMSDWWSKTGTDERNQITRAVRQGLIQGETTPEIMSRLTNPKGVFAKSHHRAEAVVRTAVNHVSTTSAMETMRGSNVVKGYEIVATLDTRTSAICREKDGKVYDFGEPHPHPPFHFNCRTTIVPVTKSWKELGVNLKEAPPGTRASMNGQVPAGLTYRDWFKKQTKKVQIDVLGPTRYKLFASGLDDVTKFATPKGRLYTIEELYAKHPDLAMDAGIISAEVASSIAQAKAIPIYQAALKKIVDDLKVPTDATEYPLWLKNYKDAQEGLIKAQKEAIDAGVDNTLDNLSDAVDGLTIKRKAFVKFLEDNYTDAQLNDIAKGPGGINKWQWMTKGDKITKMTSVNKSVLEELNEKVMAKWQVYSAKKKATAEAKKKDNVAKKTAIEEVSKAVEPIDDLADINAWQTVKAHFKNADETIAKHKQILSKYLKSEQIDDLLKESTGKLTDQKDNWKILVSNQKADALTKLAKETGVWGWQWTVKDQFIEIFTNLDNKVLKDIADAVKAKQLAWKVNVDANKAIKKEAKAKIASDAKELQTFLTTKTLGGKKKDFKLTELKTLLTSLDKQTGKAQIQAWAKGLVDDGKIPLENFADLDAFLEKQLIAWKYIDDVPSVPLDDNLIYVSTVSQKDVQEFKDWIDPDEDLATWFFSGKKNTKKKSLKSDNQVQGWLQQIKDGKIDISDPDDDMALKILGIPDDLINDVNGVVGLKEYLIKKNLYDPSIKHDTLALPKPTKKDMQDYLDFMDEEFDKTWDGTDYAKLQYAEDEMLDFKDGNLDPLQKLEAHFKVNFPSTSPEGIQEAKQSRMDFLNSKAWYSPKPKVATPDAVVPPSIDPPTPSVAKTASSAITPTTVKPDPVKSWQQVDDEWEALDKSKFEYVRSASSMGGAHSKHIFRNTDTGEEWMFKPVSKAGRGGGDAFIASGEEASYKIERMLDPSTNQVRLINLEVNGEMRAGSIQEMIPHERDFRGVAPRELTADMVEQFQREHVMDWLTSNHDSHYENFLQNADGHIFGIDKGQAYKYFGNDRLDIDYEPNRSYGTPEPYYNTIAKAVQRGEIAMDANNTLKYINVIERMTDDEFLAIIKPYADGRFRVKRDWETFMSKDDFLNAALERKHNLRKDFRDYYRKVLKDRKFDFDETALIADNKYNITEDIEARVDTVEAQGFQGQTIPFDELDVEDQNLLIYTDKIKKTGKIRSNASLRIRPGSDAKVMKFIDQFDQNTAPDLTIREDVFSDDISIAVRSANHHASDLAYVASKTDKALGHRTALKKLVKSKDADVKAMATTYLKVLDELEDITTNKTGKKLAHFSAYERKPSEPKPKSPNEPTVTKGKAKKYNRTLTDDGILEVSSDNLTNVEKRLSRVTDSDEYVVKYPDGTVIQYRPWDSNVTYAMRGQMDIVIPEKPNTKTLNGIFDKLEEMGIEARVATAEDTELMYLMKHAYITRMDQGPPWKKMMAELDSADADKSARISAMRVFWSKHMKVKDVTKLPSYKPEGIYDISFTQFKNNKAIQSAGSRRQERFDLPDDLEEELKDYTIYHDPDFGGDMDSFFESGFLKKNGQFITNNQKVRWGISLKGSGSPDADFGSGGANYAYTRWKHKRDKGRLTGFFFKTRLARRADTVSYDSDHFGDMGGRTNENVVRNDRYIDPSLWKQISNESGNETVFKDGFNFLEEIDLIVTEDGAQLKRVLQHFKDAGIDTLPDGRKVIDIVVERK